MRRDPTSLLETCKSLISDPTVCASLGYQIPDSPSSIKIDNLNSTVLNMNYFDVLMTDDEVITSTDMVRACMDETFDGITIQDKLREMLINPDSENGCLFTEEQKNEFIYHMLKLVVVGGAMCQSEEKVRRREEGT